MRPVVSSLVAIALAIAPLTAFAAKPIKTDHAKVVHADKSDEKADKADADDDKEAAPKKGAHASSKKGAHAHKGAISPVHAQTSHADKKTVLKPVVHHAHDVDLGGSGHGEPKVHNAIVPASMVTKTEKTEKTEKFEKSEKAEKAEKSDKSHDKSDKIHAKPTKGELPKLPNPHAGKPSKGGAEKGARKATEKKNESHDSDSADDGQPGRDEEIADLVAQIRGHQSASSRNDTASSRAEPQPDDADEKGAKRLPAAKGAKGSERGPDSASDGDDADLVPVKPKSPFVRSSSPPPPPCAKEPVEIVRGPEIERFQLTKCDGTPAPLAVERLSILIRPGGAARPTASLSDLANKPGQDLARGVRRVDVRLVSRLQSLVDHFSKPNAPAKIFVISGYRPQSVGSMHSSGRAIDFRVEGTRNEDVVAFCKTLNDTGCGYYPNSSFVHVDVRDPGAGHVAWIDASGPGETPRYVRSWPPPLSQSRAVDRVSTEELEREGVQILRAQRPMESETPNSVGVPLDDGLGEGAH